MLTSRGVRICPNNLNSCPSAVTYDAPEEEESLAKVSVPDRHASVDQSGHPQSAQLSPRFREEQLRCRTA